MALTRENAALTLPTVRARLAASAMSPPLRAARVPTEISMASP